MSHLSVRRISSGFTDMIRLQAVEQTLDDCDESIEQFMQPNLPFTFDILLSLRVRIHLINIPLFLKGNPQKTKLLFYF